VCGIAGVFHFGVSEPVDEATLHRMTETLVHRGPDDRGFYLSPDGRIGLGNRRLAIVDVAAGHQPMTNEDGSLFITYNGEVYNHAALRAELVQRGHRYKTRSDTETVLHLYEEKGCEAVHDLRGMFAFALWDGERGELWLVRDRVGVKPLYYTQVGGRLLFASEIKALLAHPLVGRRLDLEGMYHYLTFMTTPAPRTLFAGIEKLPAGHWLRCGADGARVERYWDAIVSPGPPRSETEWVAGLRALLADSIRDRMMSDVPLGVFLSGGVDSSAIAAVMHEASPTPINTFSVGFRDGGPHDERPHARAVATRLGTRHHEVAVDARDAVEFIPRLIYYQDEPIGDPVCFPLYYVARLAREHGVVVVQTGEGSDELFSGYPGYLEALRRARLVAPYRRLPPGLRRVGYAVAAPVLRAAGKAGVLELLERTARGQAAFWGGAVVFTEGEKRRLLAPSVLRRLDGLSSHDEVARWYRRIAEAKPESDLLERMIYLELKLRLPELLLMRADKFTMAASVEAREPYLDHRLVEYAMAMPSHLKVRGGPKGILKRALAPLLPAEVLARPKQGFNVPVGEWLRGGLGEAFRARILGSRARELFEAGSLDALLRQPAGGRPEVNRHLWLLMNLSCWYDRWIDPPATSTP
jgi:asparagine synthase (glutamine-hydrolysing)